MIASLSLQHLYDTNGLVALDALHGGSKIVFGTLVLTALLEICSIDTVKNLWKQHQGKELYWTGVVLNFFNHIVIGIPLYIFAVVFFCRTQEVEDNNSNSNSNNKSSYSWLIAAEVLWVVTVHSFLYYKIHKAFHESPHLFQLFHKFHHRYNAYVPPSSANSVSVGEYVLAYLVPFLVAVVLRSTSTLSLSIALWIISITNLLVHTPRLEFYYPSHWLLVSTKDHSDHHRKLKVHYASPTLNIDNLIQYLSFSQKTKKLQD